MNATSQKQTGDLVTITGGPKKEQEGVLQEKVSKGWNIKLRSGEVVLTSFPFVKLIAKKGEFEDGEPWKSILAGEVAEDKDAPNSPESPCTASRETGDEIVALGEDIAQTSTGAAGNGGVEDSIANMTILQLRNLAKQKGVAIARTKADFIRIIKEVSPGANLDQLKGKALFDKVSELHISRLRSKEDLRKLLSS